MRVKNYLSARGVEFVAVNVKSEARAIEDLKVLGATAVPVVTRGERHVLGVDFAQIDALLGLANDPASLLLPANELVERALRILAAAARYARQLPGAHYNDPCPGNQVFLTPGGKPLHATSLGLVRHLVAHATKVKLLVENRCSEVFADLGLMSRYGEPAESTPLEELTGQLDAAALALRRWWRNCSPADLRYEMSTCIGRQSFHKMLQLQTYSLVQHTRQLMTVLEDLGIEPDGPIGEADYEGLQMPAAVWD